MKIEYNKIKAKFDLQQPATSKSGMIDGPNTKEEKLK